MTYKLGSLFDGSGGFTLAGAMFGIHPTWASEIEPYPIAVTRERIPTMKHLGDISKINGAEIEPVDIIIFGSPCQDLSVAGKRAGLRHESNGDEETTRSGLFMESVRIIKEMREATNGLYPRFAFWENVPGAFSSQRGEDLRVVLEELIKIAEPAAVMPPVPEKGWAYADSYTGDGWSLAYRVFDAQYWGVPQRRRRIHLVLDLRGECARKILFEREGLRGYFTEGRTPWEGTAPDAQGSLGTADREGEDKTVNTLTGDHNNRITDYTSVMAAPKGFTMQGFGDYKDCEVASGLKARDYKDATDLVTEAKPVVLDRAFFNQGQNAKYDPQFYTDGTVPTLVARGSAAVQVQYIVRRLTPTECARLQGFPDWWGHIAQKDDLTDEEYRFWLDVRNTHAKINDKPEKDYTKAQMLSWYNKLHTDSAEYKMWGNGIALPPALYCMQGIMEVLNAEKAREETTEEAMSEIMEETTEETIEAESPLHDRNDSIDSRNYAFIALQALNTDTPEEEQRDPALPEEDNIMEEKEDELMDPTTIHAPADRELREQTAQTAEQAPEGFDAVERLYQLKDEREKLANLTGNTRFADDARALGYAITVLEAVGL